MTRATTVFFVIWLSLFGVESVGDPIKTHGSSSVTAHTYEIHSQDQACAQYAAEVSDYFAILAEYGEEENYEEPPEPPPSVACVIGISSK